jgi:hypothetical protein
MPVLSMPRPPREPQWSQLNRGTKPLRAKDGEPVWIDRDGLRWRLSEITDHHLQSLERWLLGRGAEDIPARKKAYNEGWYTIIRDELERRGLKTLEDHRAIEDEFTEVRTPELLRISEPPIDGVSIHEPARAGKLPWAR